MREATLCEFKVLTLIYVEFQARQDDMVRPCVKPESHEDNVLVSYLSQKIKKKDPQYPQQYRRSGNNHYLFRTGWGKGRKGQLGFAVQGHFQLHSRVQGQPELCNFVLKTNKVGGVA